MEPSIGTSARAAARIPAAIFLFGALFGVLGTLAVVRQTHTVRVVERGPAPAQIMQVQPMQLMLADPYRPRVFVY